MLLVRWGGEGDHVAGRGRRRGVLIRLGGGGGLGPGQQGRQARWPHAGRKGPLWCGRGTAVPDSSMAVARRDMRLAGDATPTEAADIDSGGVDRWTSDE